MFRNVIIFLTNRCSVGCATCNIGALPDKGQYLTPDWLRRFLPGLHDFSQPIYLIWTGGEPFEVFDSLLVGIRSATKLGFHSEILTSGCWYDHHRDYLNRLCDTGTFRLRISLDAEHQRIVPMESIHSLIDEILDRRIALGFTLRTIPGSLPTTDDYKALLLRRHPALTSAQETSSRLFHVIPTIPAGIPGDTEPAREGGPILKKMHSVVTKHQETIDTKGFSLFSGISRNAIGPCKLGFRDLVIGPDGRRYPCCGLFGLGIDDHIATGDALAELAESITMQSAPQPHLHELAVQGAYTLALQNGIIPDVFPVSGYASQCHVCRLVFPVMLAMADSGSSDIDKEAEQ